MRIIALITLFFSFQLLASVDANNDRDSEYSIEKAPEGHPSPMENEEPSYTEEKIEKLRNYERNSYSEDEDSNDYDSYDDE